MCIRDRNLRLTAIHSFFRYAQAESPEALYHYQKVLAIPVKKKHQAVVEHLSPCLLYTSFEILSGHRRLHAAQLAGLETVPVIVKEMDDDAAIIFMVEMCIRDSYFFRPKSGETNLSRR